MYCAQLMLIFYQIINVHGVQVQVDGLVKLGPKLHYDLQIHQQSKEMTNFELKSKSSETHFHANSIADKKPIERTIKIGDGNKIPKRSSAHINITVVIVDNVNKTTDDDNTNVLVQGDEVRQRAQIQKPHRIKDDVEIQKYIVHIYNKALILFDSMQERFKDKINKHHFHKLKQLYKERMEEYTMNIANQTLRTKLGVQKALLNSLNISMRVIKKLLDNMPVFSKGSLRSDDPAITFIQKEFENELTQEFSHLCQQYRICRTKRSFSDLLVEMLTMILKTDDVKVKQASDALTEVLRDFSLVKIMDWESHKSFRIYIRNLENTGGAETKVAFIILKNVIANRNQPIPIYGTENMALVNKTVAFQDVINEFDKVIPGNGKNLREWDDILFRLDQWVNLKEYRGSIMSIWSNLFEIIRIGVDDMSEEVAQNVRKNIRLILV